MNRSFFGLAVAAAVLASGGVALGQGYPGAAGPQVPGGGLPGAQAPGGGLPGAQAPDQGQGGDQGAVDQTQAGAPLPPWVITPAIQVDGSFTDNVRQTATRRQADVYTTVSPSIFINGETPRLMGVFSYSPQAIEYANATDQDQIIQNLLTNGTLTAIKDRLFFDVNGSMSQNSRAGDRGFGNTTVVPTNLSTQTIAYSGSPYLRFRFGDTGDAELRYRFGQTVFNGNTGPVASNIPGQTLGALSNSTQNEASARVTSGDVLARTTLGFTADYTNVGGAASLDSEHTIAEITGSYALTSTFSLTADGGYEKLMYPNQTPGIPFAGNVSGPTYHAGFRYAPRDDRNVTLNYGRTEGQNTFAGNMVYALTALTQISASYSQTTQSQQQSILQNTLSATQLVPGQTINQQTGLPLSVANPNLALQNAVSHLQTLQAGILMQGGERNHYSLTYNRTEETTLTVGALSQTSDGVIAGWTRDLSPLATGVLSAGYSTTMSSAVGTPNIHSDSITAGLSFNYSLTETLIASAGYTFVRQSISGGSGTILTDLATISLRKSF